MGAGLAGIARGAAALARLMVTGGTVVTIAHSHAGRAVETFGTIWREGKLGFV